MYSRSKFSSALSNIYIVLHRGKRIPSYSNEHFSYVNASRAPSIIFLSLFFRTCSFGFYRLFCFTRKESYPYCIQIIFLLTWFGKQKYYVQKPLIILLKNLNIVIFSKLLYTGAERKFDESGLNNLFNGSWLTVLPVV